MELTAIDSPKQITLSESETSTIGKSKIVSSKESEEVQPPSDVIVTEI